MGETARENITNAAIGGLIVTSIPQVEMWTDFKILGSVDQEEVAVYSTPYLGRGVNLAPRKRGALRT
jgi:hypothetical protein